MSWLWSFKFYLDHDYDHDHEGFFRKDQSLSSHNPQRYCTKQMYACLNQKSDPVGIWAILKFKRLWPCHPCEIGPFFVYRTVPFFDVTVTVSVQFFGLTVRSVRRTKQVFWPFPCLTANFTAPKTDHFHFL